MKMVKPNSSVAGGSCFFLIFHPKLHGNETKIPSGFVRDFLKEVPDRMVLKCESAARPWPVRLLKSGNYVFLEDGWKKFVQDNSLQKNNFLVFTYDGNAELAVQIFDDTGLERDFTTASETHQEGAESPSVPQDQNGASNGSSKEERIRSFLSNCRNDLFEKQMKRYNVSHPFTLRIPLGFAEDHLGKDKAAVRLINGKDEEAGKVNYTYNAKSKECMFVGGWSKFARRNKLKIGDICIFELVAEKTFRVIVF